MARIPSRGTEPELTLRRAVWASGVRYRLKSKLPGRPDIVIHAGKIALFIDGCFWHGCPQHYSAPSTNCDFWAKKLKSNIERDAKVDEQLLMIGWLPMHIWQHELKDLTEVVERIKGVQNKRVAGRYRKRKTGKRTNAKRVKSPWYQCKCGSEDTQVLAVDSPGSLRKNAVKRPNRAKLRCRTCGYKSDRKIA